MAYDLFSYPQQPGYKRPGTSRTAAIIMARSSSAMRTTVLKAIRESPNGLTADEVAANIRNTVLATRPRLSELVAERKIEPTGATRKNESGRPAKVWRVVR